MKVATECFRDPVTKKYLLTQVANAVKDEVCTICSDSTNSILRSQSQEDLKTFTWSRLLAELSVHAPILYSILRAATKVKRERSNTDAVTCTGTHTMAKMHVHTTSTPHKCTHTRTSKRNTQMHVCTHTHTHNVYHFSTHQL